MSLAFLVSWVVSKLDTSADAAQERAAYDDQYVRAQTGFGVAAAVKH
jgi:cation/acetate symporter